MSSVKPHIVLKETEIVVKIPFHIAAKDELKSRIPFEERTWDGLAKAWKLSAKEENFKIAIEVLSKHFPGKPLVFNANGDIQATFKTRMDTTSYYTLLKVEETATTEEIKKAHRKLVLQLHPDKNPDDSRAEEHFMLVQQAYKTLNNPKTRKKYDLSRSLMYGGKKKSIEEEDDFGVGHFARHFQAGGSTTFPSATTTSGGLFNYLNQQKAARFKSGPFAVGDIIEFDTKLQLNLKAGFGTVVGFSLANWVIFRYYDKNLNEIKDCAINSRSTQIVLYGGLKNNDEVVFEQGKGNLIFGSVIGGPIGGHVIIKTFGRRPKDYTIPLSEVILTTPNKGSAINAPFSFINPNPHQTQPPPPPPTPPPSRPKNQLNLGSLVSVPFHPGVIYTVVGILTTPSMTSLQLRCYMNSGVSQEIALNEKSVKYEGEFEARDKVYDWIGHSHSTISKSAYSSFRRVYELINGQIVPAQSLVLVNPYNQIFTSIFNPSNST